jgi:hypothetical protein
MQHPDAPLVERFETLVRGAAESGDPQLASLGPKALERRRDGLYRELARDWTETVRPSVLQARLSRQLNCAAFAAHWAHVAPGPRHFGWRNLGYRLDVRRLHRDMQSARRELERLMRAGQSSVGVEQFVGLFRSAVEAWRRAGGVVTAERLNALLDLLEVPQPDVPSEDEPYMERLLGQDELASLGRDSGSTIGQRWRLGPLEYDVIHRLTTTEVRQGDTIVATLRDPTVSQLCLEIAQDKPSSEPGLTRLV